RVTYLAAIPTQLIKILRNTDLTRYDLRSLRVVRTGAAAFDAALARETEEKMNCRVLIAGGAQETYSFGQTGVDDALEKRLYTLGKPFPGNEVKIANGKGKERPQGEVGELFDILEIPTPPLRPGVNWEREGGTEPVIWPGLMSRDISCWWGGKRR
ncbi:MAG: AMP-binding protein, partial [Desulfobacteraceae bacterium]